MDTENISSPELTESGQAQVASGEQSGGQTAQTEKTSTQPGQAQRTQAEAEESFYADFNSLPQETQETLRPYYKQMQGAFTRKAQELAKQRQATSQKVQAYDQFMQSPVENILRMAQQYGLQLSPGGQVAQNQQQPATAQDWTPNTWEEVFSKSGEYLSPKIKEMLSEVVGPYEHKIAMLEKEVSEVRANRVKRQLDQIDPNWQLYEDEMRQILEQIPQLANDIPKLYKLAVPQEVLESRATQQALKRYEQKTAAAKVESSGHNKISGPVRGGIKTFEEAFQEAKRQLGRK